jgi:hypothetical protein
VYWSPDMASARWEGTSLMFDAATEVGLVHYVVPASVLHNVAQRTGSEALHANIGRLRSKLNRTSLTSGTIVTFE